MQRLHEKHYTLSNTALVHMLQDTRERTLALVDDLQDAQFEVPLLALVNPLRWELGHVTFFYEAFVLQMLGSTTPGEGAEDLYDSFKIDHDDRWSLPLPSRQGTLAVHATRCRCGARTLEGHAPSAQETYLYLLAVLHEDMHRGSVDVYAADASPTPRHNWALSRLLPSLRPWEWPLAGRCGYPGRHV